MRKPPQVDEQMSGQVHARPELNPEHIPPPTPKVNEQTSGQGHMCTYELKSALKLMSRRVARNTHALNKTPKTNPHGKYADE